MTTTKQFIDGLWASYEESPALADFKEELAANLDAKIANLTGKGMDAEAAFQKATAELGDVGKLADELALKKKQEVFEEAFMDIRRYMKPRRVAAYIACGVVFVFGIIVAVISFFSVELAAPFMPPAAAAGATGGTPGGLGAADAALLPWVDFLGVLLAFIPAAIAGWTFLGLTQESAAAYPMKTKRALGYAGATLLLLFGLFVFGITWFSTQGEAGQTHLVAALATLIPFVIPAAALYAALGLTEKSRLKPWMQKYCEEETRRHVQAHTTAFTNPAAAARFGVFSGGLWIAAIGLFLLLGFLIGFAYSWLVFIFTIAAQLFLQGALIKPADAGQEGAAIGARGGQGSAQ